MAKKYFLDKRTFVNTKNLGGGLLQTSASPANTQLDLANFLDLEAYIETVTEEVIAGQPLLVFPDGTAAAPGITFVGDTDTGIYLGGNNILDFSVAGTKTLDVRTSQVTVEGVLRVTDVTRGGDGAVGAPGFSFISNTDTGIYAVSGTQTGFSSNGALVGGFNDSGLFTDVIAEQTSTVGVTVDGVILKDSTTKGVSAIIAGVPTEGPGLLTLKSKSAIKALTGGATEVIPVQVPAGAVIVACQLRNNTIVTATTGVTYSAAYSTGATQTISTGTAYTKNTKVNTLFDTNAATAITTGATDVTLTPDAGTLDTGTVEATVYYYELTAMTDAA